MFPENGPTYVATEGVRWSCPLEKLDDAARIIDGAYRAAPSDKLSAALYRLRTLTLGREQRSASDQEAEYAIWIENLLCYPGDIVIAVLESWHLREDGKFWPTWHEVAAELNRRIARRGVIANFVRAAIERGVPALPAPEPLIPVADIPGAGERIAAHWDAERQRWEKAGHARPLGKRKEVPEQVARKAEAALDELRGIELPKISAEALKLTLAKHPA
jgi:hypothetical protein